MAVVTITYSHSAWSCNHRSGCHSALPKYECARSETMKAISKVETSAARKYTNGIAMRAVASFEITVAMSEIGMDFQNRTLRSLRSA